MDCYTAPSFSLSGPSGCGKTTIISRLIAAGLDIEFSVSATNRLPRADEIHGINYYFMSTEEFKDRIAANEFLEYEEVYPGQFYGTLWSEISRLVKSQKVILLDVDVAGAKKLKTLRQELHSVLFIHLPYPVIEKRLRDRGTESEAEIQKRLKKAQSELDAMHGHHPIISNSLNDNGAYAAMRCERFIREKIGKPTLLASKAKTSPFG